VVEPSPPLTPSEFFSALPAALRPLLPTELRAFHRTRGHGRLLKLDYGHTKTHFEAWHHVRTGRLEIGLHFEGPPPLNQSALTFFRPRMVEIRATLPRAELEPWERGWSRLYETLGAVDLGSDLVAAAAGLMARYITTLAPMLDEFWRQTHGSD
jgi:hypothetical protein